MSHNLSCLVHFQSTIKAASIEDDVIDEDVPDSDDIILPIEEIDVWIDPLGKLLLMTPKYDIILK